MTDKTINTICFGGEDWWYHNRSHIDMQLMRRFAHLGTTLYINSIVMQKPNLKKNTAGGKSFSHKLWRKTKSIFRGLKETDAGFKVYSPFSLPLHHIGWAKAVNKAILKFQVNLVTNKLKMDAPLIWVACPAACDIAIEMNKRQLVYQRTDRFEDYPNVDTDVIREYDRKLKDAADLTVFVNNTLYSQEHGQCKRAIYLDHGVDFELFANAHSNPEIPDDIKNIRKPIAGFFGAIDNHTSDINLIVKVVKLLKDFSFVFVGNASSDCSALKAEENVYMLGQKPYEQVPQYAKNFDVCFMPWCQNSWIEACNPIKLKEYLAMGKPIVSTPFAELEKYKNVTYNARTPEEFAGKIRNALAEDTVEKAEARREKVRNASWDAKAEIVFKTLFENNE
jgi:glycosyltransferase involved in cell wall biosynthesis